MALAVQIMPYARPAAHAPVTRSLVSRLSEWFSATLDASAADNSGAAVTTEAQIEAAQSATHITKWTDVSAMGTAVRVRLAYGRTITGITAPSVQVLGKDLNGAVQVLRSLTGDKSATLSPAADDWDDATSKFTTPDDAATFDLDGCRYFAIAVKTALAATGTVNTSIVQTKVI